MAQVSSDPHAFLRPIYRQLAANRSFALLSTETQFGQLVEAVAELSERHASRMRGYTYEARAALLRHLAEVERQRPGARQVELWMMHKASRTLACVVVYLPHGVDVRLLEDGDVRRTQLVPDGPQAEALAEDWHRKALALGWS